MKNNFLSFFEKSHSVLNNNEAYINKWVFVIYALSGFISALPFFNQSLGFLSFVCLVPSLLPLFCRDYSARQLYALGFVRSYVFYFCVYSWFCELYPLSFLGIGNFESFCIVAGGMIFIPLLHSLAFGFFYVLAGKTKFLRVLAIPSLWIIFEYMQSLGSLAFPWAKISLSVSAYTPFIQSAELFGNYFISFLIVLINSLVAFSFCGRSKKNSFAAIMALFIFLSNCVYGVIRIQSIESSEKQFINAVIVQGNVNSNEKWQSDSLRLITQKYADLMTQASKEGGRKTDLFVLPETAIPVSLDPRGERVGTVQEFYTDFCKLNGVNMVVGAFSDTDNTSENCAFFIDRQGNIHEKPYSKQHLVPFGEYLPYRGIFEKIAPSLANMNAMSQDLKKGNEPRVVQSDFGKIGSIVCFDSVFDEIARKSVLDGAEIFCVITNDSWYGDSAALIQHNSQSVYRAVENRRHVLRAANTGISTSISLTGKVLDKIEAQKSGIMHTKAAVSDYITLYARIGNIIVPVCLIFVLVCFFGSFRKKDKLKI